MSRKTKPAQWTTQQLAASEAEVRALREELAQMRQRYEQLEHELMLELGREPEDDD